MEKVNGTDGAQKLTGRERGGSPSYFTHVPYLLPGTYPLGRVGLGLGHRGPTLSRPRLPCPSPSNPHQCPSVPRVFSSSLVKTQSTLRVQACRTCSSLWRRRPHNTQLFTLLVRCPAHFIRNSDAGSGFGSRLVCTRQYRRDDFPVSIFLPAYSPA